MKPEFITIGEGSDSRRIAVRHRSGSPPGVIWLGGYRSDMQGTKAVALDSWCADYGRQCCRFDYSGHGESQGEFVDGTISRWLAESLAVLRRFTQGPQILVGSSMGGWIALRMAQELARSGEADRIHAMLLIAPAPDFTQELMWPQLSAEQKQQLEKDGLLREPSQYSEEPNIYTAQLFADGKRNCILGGPLDLTCPVHILQGMRDPDVPWQHAMRLVECLPAADTAVTLIKDGDHRLSRAGDIELMLRLLDQLAERDDQG